MTLGLQPGELIVIAGRPGSGRYALALQLTAYVAGHLRQPVIFHSLTNETSEFGLRLLSVVAGLDSYRMRAGELDETDWEKISSALSILHEAPLCIEENRAGDLDRCLERTEQFLNCFNDNRGLVIIDDFHVFSFQRNNSSLDDQRQFALQKLRNLSKTLNVPLVILSQLDPRVDRRPDRLPFLSDLPRSGNIEAYADTVLLLNHGTFSILNGSVEAEPRELIGITQAKSRFDFGGTCYIALDSGGSPMSRYWGIESFIA